MARWMSANTSWTPVPVADGANNFTDNGYTALQGGSATQRGNILEVYEGGQATSSNANWMVLARDQVVAVTAITAGTNGKAPQPLDTASAALAAPPLTVGASTTKPQRSATLYLLNLSFNAFGGIVRWVAAPGEEIGYLGNAANAGEISLSAFLGSGTGLMGSHFVFEPF